jgi:2-keto-4-pentenoate hydratase/2-oxohepta-3-ene-1,7-dioic acid hydratase in catechol pathway
MLGYTVGNDVSAWSWQVVKESGGQHGYTKSFDKFAPTGRALVSTKMLPNPSKIHMKTWVNGDLRQETPTGDLRFGVHEIIQHASRGTTLKLETIIMSGTPNGVGWFTGPPGFVKDGDVVEIKIDEIGSIKNKIIFSYKTTARKYKPQLRLRWPKVCVVQLPDIQLHNFPYGVRKDNDICCLLGYWLMC